MLLSRALRYRLGEADDLARCASLVRSSETLPDHIEAALPYVWQSLLGKAIFFTIEDQEMAKPEAVRAFGLSMIVREDFVDQVLAHPGKASLPGQFYEGLLTGKQMLLDDAEIGSRNCGDGVDVAALHFSSADNALPGLPEPDVLRHGMGAFHAGHSGYRVRRLFFEAHSEPAAQVLADAGFRCIRCGAAPPYLMAMEREFTQPGIGPLSQIFFTPPPRLYFTSAERRLLERAVHGEKDAQAAHVLGVSEETIKKTWQNVFRRAARELPSIFSWDSADSGVRGPERRTKLLEYVRGHPEELRPWTRPD